jgi:transposase InsO family protein
MCRVLGVSEKQYYQWRIQEERRNGRRLEERELVQRIEEAFHASDDAYGCRKITRELRNEGIAVSEWKVRRIMREHGLYSVTQKKYRPFRHHQETNPYKQDLVKQQFRPDGPNVVWAGDITYIKTKIGWVYLAIVMDLYNREVIGYATSQRIDTELVKRALGEAVGRYPDTQGTIFHSDRGTQYAGAGQRYFGALTTVKMERMVTKCIDKSLQGKAKYVPGVLNQIVVFLTKFLPIGLITRLLCKRWRKAQATCLQVR